MYIIIKFYKKNKIIFIVLLMLKSGIIIFLFVCRLLVFKIVSFFFKINILCYLICFMIIEFKIENILFY